MATTTITGKLFFSLGAILTTSIYHHSRSRSRSDRKSHSIVRTKEAEKDRITHLPGLRNTDSLKFEQFSGYLDAAKTRHVFYWYVESESNPDTDPVVLWSNGGPGCSGLLGFGAEHGPFVLDEKGELYPTQYSWNRIANMLYVEQPAGVGFSYTDSEADKTTNDMQAAQDNYRLILDFLRKFPERRLNDFYIASESYGGHYMPQLALEILKQNQNKFINFRGFMVGNPFVDPFSNTITQFESYYSHGLLAKPLYDIWKENCRSRKTYMSDLCEEITDAMFVQFDGDTSINPYALDYPVCLDTFKSLEKADKLEKKEEQKKKGKHGGIRSQRLGTAHSKGAYTSSAQQDTLLNSTEPNFLPSQAAYKPCSQVYLEHYLNDHKVRTALHVLDRASYKWSPCGGINYSAKDVDTPVIYLYQKLLDMAAEGKHDLKMLIFSGDNDSICATAGTQDWIWNLGLRVLSMWQPWKADEQVSGFVTKFDLGPDTDGTFSFVTVHGAGHEVPAYKPQEALALFKMYLDGDM